ncbi:hypothetical protein FRB90_011794 [Tulasnella sp. 427]|nr:hypothetical protein FRB90_011794 [Tulasnella sp. 427]
MESPHRPGSDSNARSPKQEVCSGIGANQPLEDSTFPTNPALRDKLKKLSSKRLSVSSIEFPADAQSYRGGFSTVSRALLSYPQSGETGGHIHGEDEDTKSAAFDKDEEVKSRVSNDDEGAEYSDSKDKELISQALEQKLALREADFLFELSHPNVVELEGFVEDVGNKTIWLVFPWAEHGTLKEFVASREWEIPERLALIHDVAHGVDYLHGQESPIYHGDLKSVNILVNWLYRAVITDFGSARRLSNDKLVQQTNPSKYVKDHLIIDQEEEDQVLEQALLTTSGDMMTLTGDKYTIRWAAPELLDECLPTLSCDIWSLGWVAYEVRYVPQ